MADVPLGHPMFGKAVHCPKCTNWFAFSGLSRHEYALDWSKLAVGLATDSADHLKALAYAGRRMVADQFGFATVYGNNGTAKTRWGKIIVAEFCRRSLSALYVHAKGLEEALFSNDDDNRQRMDFGRLGRYLEPTCLVIDEAQTLNWKNDWIAGHLSQLLEQRHELATAEKPSRKVTILIGQFHPNEWGPLHTISFLLSRVADGAFAIPWADDAGPIPASLRERPCSCGGRMVMDKARALLVCGSKTCRNSRPVEVYWPFCLPMADARPLMPPLIDQMGA